MVILFALSALASGVNNPGGERIPYVKLQSESWDVVIRMTGEGRARIERIKAQCKPGMWVNGCAPGVDPQLRQLALSRVFQDTIQLSGNFGYCSTALVRNVPVDLARQLIRATPDAFCSVFLNPESVRGLRSNTASQGEQNLVSRLMGGQNTTSGKIRIKAPPSLNPSSGTGEERVATGERRTAQQTANNRRLPVPPAKQPMVPAPPTPLEDDSDDWFELPEGEEPIDEQGLRTAAAERQASLQSPSTKGGGGLLLDDADDDDLFRPEPPRPKPEPIDAELAALLAPLPGLPEKDQIIVPAPRPQPTRTADEFERLAREDDALMRMTRGTPEEEKKREKKEKKDKKNKERNDETEIGTDEDFGDYIIVDIESLPD